MSKAFRGKKFTAGATRENIEKFVKDWFDTSGFKSILTFLSKGEGGSEVNVYYNCVNLVQSLANYLERFLKVQLEDGRRSWVIFTPKQLHEAYRKMIEFYTWENCERVGSNYRKR